MLRKPKLYKKAIALRRKGFSYNEILRHVSVGHGTVSRWCCNIPLTEKQRKRLWKRKVRNPFILGVERKALQRKKEARTWAKEQINKIPGKNESLLVMGAILYWAEGTRFADKPTIEFTNTNPQIIRITMRFFRKIINIPENKFRITVRIREGGDVKKAEKYWSRITRVSKSNFRRPEILELSKNSKSLKKYPYGMCRIVVFDALSFRKIIALIEELSKKILEKKSEKKRDHS